MTAQDAGTQDEAVVDTQVAEDEQQGQENATAGGTETQPAETTPDEETVETPPEETVTPDVPDEGDDDEKVEAKAKSKPKPRKPRAKKEDDANSEKALKSEWDSIMRVVKEKGSVSRDRKRIKVIAKKLGKDAPEWASGKDGSGKGKSDKPARIDDPDLQLAHTATALATKGEVKDGKVILGPVKFGAAVNTTQVREMRDRLKGKNVLQFLGGVSERKLKDYAQGEVKLSDLDEDVRVAFKELNRTFDSKLKMWARKDAVIAYCIHMERKKANRKSTKKASEKKAEPVAV